MIANEEFFPESSRTIYDISPLFEVVCQVRFPTILRIENNVPADFQDLIRSTYPYFERQGQLGIPQLPKEVAELLGAASQNANYLFRTDDQKHTLSLTSNSLALTSQNYRRWEDFTQYLLPALDALKIVYQPSFYSRIGLRYQNAVDPSKLGVDSTPWAVLLNKNILGELSNVNFGAARITEAHRMLRIVSEASSDGILLQHGLGRMAEATNDSYIIDIDCYTDQRIEVQNAISVLGTFNQRARRAFRWCITDRLHELLGPNELDVVGG